VTHFCASAFVNRDFIDPIGEYKVRIEHDCLSKTNQISRSAKLRDISSKSIGRRWWRKIKTQNAIAGLMIQTISKRTIARFRKGKIPVISNEITIGLNIL
jgi:hypothetical protein